jgi:hypothetical protein
MTLTIEDNSNTEIVDSTINRCEEELAVVEGQRFEVGALALAETYGEEEEEEVNKWEFHD